MKSQFVLMLSAIALAGAAAFANAPPVAGVNDSVVRDIKFPRKLSDYGFFTDSAGQVPAANVTPYRLNTPLYSDGAEKLRFLYLPDGASAAANGGGLIDIPVGGALIKTFAFGEGADRRLIETRVMLHREDGWLALPYKWNDDQSEAKLAIAGARVNITAPGGEDISYRVPNKNQCKECHGLDGAVVPIGPKARNLSHGWLETLAGQGLLDIVPAKADTMPMWEDRSAKETPVDAAARAYLDVNCAHCHQPGATASNSGLDLRWEQDERRAIGINKRPVAAGRGSAGLMFDIVPGQPNRSILLHRMRNEEPGVAMPELGKATIDHEGVAIVERWIRGMN